jgi:uncharacterized protein
MRSSSYNILVKVDKQNEVYAILNSYTRAFDIINNDVHTFLKGKGNSGSISRNTLDKLVKRGYLTPLSKLEEVKLAKNLLDKTHSESQFKSYNFHFIISYDCNLRCVYCYEDDLLNSNTCLSKETITYQNIDKAFEVIKAMHEEERSSKVISLYGGEPFLAENYDVLLHITKRAKEINHTFKVTSNGYDLDKYFDFLKDNKIFSFQITIDGVEDIHNLKKPHYKNNDSFNKISRNVDYLLKLGAPVRLRINIDSQTIGRINELMNYFETCGWYNYSNFSAYWALLRAEVASKDLQQRAKTCETCNSNQKNSFNQLSLLKHYYEEKDKGKIDKAIKCQDFGIYETLKTMILGNVDFPYRSSFCGSQNGNIIFDPFGDLYSCWDVVGQHKHKIGQYIPDFQIYPEAYDKWFNKKVGDYNCVKCKYSPFCGGGCIIKTLRENGKIELGNCNDYPKLFNFLLGRIYDELYKEQ